MDKNRDPGKYYGLMEEIVALESEINARKDAEIEFILRATPYIKDYTSVTQATEKKYSRGLDGFVQVMGVSQNQKVFQKYMLEVEGDIRGAHAVVEDKNEEGVCVSCKSEMVVNAREWQLICTGCGMTKPYLEHTCAHMTYDQETSQTSVVSVFAYQRSNHFAEWLARLQGKENTEIPAEVIEAVSVEFKKIKATKRCEITPSKVREFLRKLRLQKYYEHTYIICNQLNGMPPPKLEPALEEELKRMFAKIQEPFKKLQQENKIKNRKNFLSYSYVLYKFCELLECDDLLKYFPLLKSKEKLYNQDQIFKSICKELGWTFYKSC
jgi:predicted RNA-binding Zn-ribbon protein involved in translation (DUF1610 family)